MTKTTEYADELRAWKQRLCEHLGMNPHQVFGIADAPHAIANTYLGQPPVTGTVVTYDATHEQSPSLGMADRPSWQRDGENAPSTTGNVYLSPHEWEDVIAAIGPKPQLLTRTEELILKGLAAEAAESQS